MKNFNKFLYQVSLYVNAILEYINILILNIIIMSIRNIFVVKYILFPVHSIDLNTINYGLIQFKLRDINYDNIKGIVFDYFHSGFHGYRYMRIYNNKGQLVMNIG
jgi:hypothetical protein